MIRPPQTDGADQVFGIEFEGLKFVNFVVWITGVIVAWLRELC